MQLKYNFNWPKFTDHLQEMMHKMMKSEDFTDVILVCDDMKQIKTHMNILSACSPIFRNLLKNHIPHGHPVIYLRGIQYEDMDAILHFLYLGEAKVAPGRMNQFMLSAKSLEIKELCSLENEEGLKKTKRTQKNYAEIQSEKEQNIDNKAVNVNINELEEKTKSLEIEIKELCSPENEEGLKRVKNTKIDDEMQSDKEQNFDNETVNINASEDKGEKKPVNQNWVSHQCPKCVLKFMDVSRLENHILETHKPFDSRYICEHCSKKFSSSTILRTHVRSIHEGIRHSCPHCGNKFKQGGTLANHIKVVHEGMKYTCDQCGIKVSTRAYLRIHIESVHEGVKYDCNLCDQKFSRKKSVEVHRLAVHEGMRFLCDQCDYQASQMGDLQVHIKNKKCSTWRRRGSKKSKDSNHRTENS